MDDVADIDTLLAKVKREVQHLRLLAQRPEEDVAARQALEEEVQQLRADAAALRRELLDMHVAGVFLRRWPNGWTPPTDAGRALLDELQRKEAATLAIIERLREKEAERAALPTQPALVEINAPLALQQLALDTRIETLRWVRDALAAHNNTETNNKER
jgi:hypothetical protein